MAAHAVAEPAVEKPNGEPIAVEAEVDLQRVCSLLVERPLCSFERVCHVRNHVERPLRRRLCRGQNRSKQEEEYQSRFCLLSFAPILG